MSVSKERQPYATERIILSSTKPIERVVAALQEEMNGAKAGQIGVLLANAKDRAEIEKGMAELTEDKRLFV